MAAVQRAATRARGCHHSGSHCCTAHQRDGDSESGKLVKAVDEANVPTFGAQELPVFVQAPTGRAATRMLFNPPPGWPPVPQGWRPPLGWQPDPSWDAIPYGWPLWVVDPVHESRRRRRLGVAATGGAVLALIMLTTLVAEVVDSGKNAVAPRTVAQAASSSATRLLTADQPAAGMQAGEQTGSTPASPSSNEPLGTAAGVAPTQQPAPEVLASASGGLTASPTAVVPLPPAQTSPQRESAAPPLVAPTRQARTRTPRPSAAPTRTLTRTARPTSPAKPRPTASPTTTAPQGVYYKNCTQAREAGVTPIYRGQPGYASHLDRDNDGVACEN